MIDKWRMVYDQVKVLGQFVKDSTPDAEGYCKLPKITKKEREDYFKEIRELQIEANHYLDKLGLFPNKPLWHYSLLDKTSQASSTVFAHTDKMTYAQIKAYGNDFMTRATTSSLFD